MQITNPSKVVDLNIYMIAVVI